MNVSDQLLDKYFKNKCTPEEKLVVENYLREIEELPDHFVQKEEWDDAEDFPISYERSDLMFEAIKKQTLRKNHKHLWLTICSIAAAVLVVLGIGFYASQTPDFKEKVAKLIPKKASKVNQISFKSINNFTDKIQKFTLPDQSTVKIYPGGELTYALPFVAAKREVFLSGTSYFHVQKDKKHPFVVYAKGVSTTALGTSFTIVADEKSKIITVKLHTGKVWVKDVDSAGRNSMFSKILLPGNALVFNRVDNKLNVETLNQIHSDKEVKSELIFSQAPLVTVFLKLEQHYKTKIIFNADDLSAMSFTGTLNLNQTINQILTELTELNKLTKERVAEGYLIKR
ncbi:FecR family protein [Pedobacter agri]|uniref:FecR family protein n=1 Tax=Pedobacter agri TaxID=454586 RepID=UPI00278889F5|nr:FecR family protein [Pedobacter agri]MDQ1140910.1 transmembrane sensor [Pedobacter agri]